MTLDACCGGSGHCSSHPSADDATRTLSRRSMLALGAAAAGGTALGPLLDQWGIDPAYAVAVPADKRLTPAQRAALTARGEPTVYRGAALDHIGMPVGGATTGQVYLAGDGRLWVWDIANPGSFPYGGADWGGVHYADPLEVVSPFRTGFALRTSRGGTTRTRSIDAEGFADVSFRGQYPVGHVELADDESPVRVSLDAFSPFVPGDAASSTLPTTILEYTVHNPGGTPVAVDLLGFAEHPVALGSRRERPVELAAAAFAGRRTRGVHYTAAPLPDPPDPRPDVVFEDWERTTYDGWTVTGTAFGAGPVTEAETPDYFRREGPLGLSGQRFVTSHNFRDVPAGGDPDGFTGTLTSAPFTVERRYVTARVGGGGHPGSTCVNVVVDGAVVASLTGANSETLRPRGIDVSRWEGRQARIQILDDKTGGWGHVNVDAITFTDKPAVSGALTDQPDYGSFALAAHDPAARVRPSVADWSTPDALFDSADAPDQVDGGRGTLTGTVTRSFRLAPGASHTVRFTMSWSFPNPAPQLVGGLVRGAANKRHYVTRFADARATATYLGERGDALAAATKLWVRTWYDDATLPHWFLERTLAPASTLATTTCFRFDDGRFYALEGTYCCDGTCTHVWNYAQSVGYLFGELERDARERVDFGIAFNPATGAIGFRGEIPGFPAAMDGQAGNVLRTYREHRMSANDAFLRRVWPRVKQAMQFLIDHDADRNGTLDGAQHNTLDTDWYGEIPWISGLYVAALRAAEAMAAEVDDAAFGATCADLATKGTARLSATLWNPTYGYFEHLVDPAHTDTVNSNRGCHLDQLFGQLYTNQLGLPRAFDADKSGTALANMYRYNFLPDPAAYKEESGIEGGRVFSVAGEPGTIMTSWPFGGADEAAGSDAAFAIGYFNEVWTGQEYQFAAGLVSDGMVEQGLAVTRAVYDRHRAEKRNPFNEIECSDHYARGMAGHAVYLAATGVDYHGPKAHLGIAPKVAADDFAAAFTAAEGWGLLRQRRSGGRTTVDVEVRYGALRLADLAVTRPAGPARSGPPAATVQLRHGAGRTTDLTATATPADGTTVTVRLAEPVRIEAGTTLRLVLA